MIVEIEEQREHIIFRDLPVGCIFIHSDCDMLRVKFSSTEYVNLSSNKCYKYSHMLECRKVIPVEIKEAKVMRLTYADIKGDREGE